MPSPFHSFVISEFLTQTAAKQPTPGGGAVASVTGALAAALAQMVVSYSAGKKSLLQHQGLHESAAAKLVRAREVLLCLADEDAAAYGLVNELSKLEAWDPRRESLAAAQLASAHVPLSVAAACVDLLRLFVELEPASNKHLRSDLAIAAVLAHAAARSAAWNVVVNLPSLDERDARACNQQLTSLLEAAKSLAAWATPEQALMEGNL